MKTGDDEHVLLDALDQLNKKQLAEEGEFEATLSNPDPEDHCPAACNTHNGEKLNVTFEAGDQEHQQVPVVKTARRWK